MVTKTLNLNKEERKKGSSNKRIRIFIRELGFVEEMVLRVCVGLVIHSILVFRDQHDINSYIEDKKKKKEHPIIFCIQ